MSGKNVLSAKWFLRLAGRPNVSKTIHTKSTLFICLVTLIVWHMPLAGLEPA